MHKLPFSIPEPSRYVSHPKVDEIAVDVNKFYRQQLNHPEGHIVDVENFIKNALGIEILWKNIPEPENRVCFAQLECENGVFKINLNQNHKTLFLSKPELLRSCLSHEIGHFILKHFDCLYVSETQGNLFNVEETSKIYFHDSAWRQLGLSYEDFVEFKNGLAKTAWTNERDREWLIHFEDRLEPDWMYWQAEQFSSCFLIPKDKLFDCLETGLNLAEWRSLYWLRDKFGVSISMIKVRLEKLRLIEVKDRQIFLTPTPVQGKVY
ncbi:MAG: ImmA/IrrE family metallo-endopeptidase [Acidobacteriota bacterium]|nr:ImmA/IrrE family metallo-endopeptidase [Acidobacteriota bacterium]